MPRHLLRRLPHDQAAVSRDTLRGLLLGSSHRENTGKDVLKLSPCSTSFGVSCIVSAESRRTAIEAVSSVREEKSEEMQRRASYIEKHDLNVLHELEHVTAAISLANLNNHLRRTRDAVLDFGRQVRETNYGLLHLSGNLESLSVTLVEMQQWSDGDSDTLHPDVLAKLDLCFFCCSILLACIDRQIKIGCSKKPNTWIWTLVGRLWRENWGWRLGEDVAQQNEALQSVFCVADCKSTEQQMSILEGREVHSAISQTFNNTCSILERATPMSILARISVWVQRCIFWSSRPEKSLSDICNRLFRRPKPTTPLAGYTCILNRRTRSQYIDRALAEEARLSRERFLAPIFYSSGSGEDRVLAELDKLSSNGAKARLALHRRPVTDVTFSTAQIQACIFDLPHGSGDRSKWIHLFEPTGATVFVTDLAMYKECCGEEPGRKDMNYLAASITMFDSVLNSRWFKSSSMILVLNNVDGFARSLMTHPLEQYFPGFSGGTDLRAATKFLLGKFTEHNTFVSPVYPVLALSNNASFTEAMCSTIQKITLRKVLEK